jgi:hypothetical protein
MGNLMTSSLVCALSVMTFFSTPLISRVEISVMVTAPW